MKQGFHQILVEHVYLDMCKQTWACSTHTKVNWTQSSLRQKPRRHVLCPSSYARVDAQQTFDSVLHNSYMRMEGLQIHYDPENS